ncbi:MAG: hypothetical protein RL173_176 [Fibrobacterota bacterium]
MSRRRYLITGGEGFIGIALARQLVSRGDCVHILDLPSRVTRSEFKLPGVSYHGGDIANPLAFSELPNSDWDTVFHLAAQSSVRNSEEQPLLDIDSNIKGTANLCNWARSTKPGSIVFTSSMAVYGAIADNVEESAACRPSSVYGISKFTGELLLGHLDETGIQIRILRLFNVYGEGQDYLNPIHGMVAIFLRQALQQKEIRTTGSLDRYRDFVHIDDVVRALLTEVCSKEMQVFNVGTGAATSIRELLALIENNLKDIIPRLPVIEEKGHSGDVFGSYANINRFRNLGWNPTVSLEEGIYRAVLDARKAIPCM